MNPCINLVWDFLLMRTVKVTQIGDSLGIVLPNFDAVIVPDETVSKFKLKQGDSVVISRDGKYANSYRVSFHTVKISGMFRLAKQYQGYSVSSKKLKKYHTIWKIVKRSRLAALLPSQTSASKCIYQRLISPAEGIQNNLASIHSDDPNILKQLEPGREFMREFRKTFQALAS
jgi:hypothetical protein